MKEFLLRAWKNTTKTIRHKDIGDHSRKESIVLKSKKRIAKILAFPLLIGLIVTFNGFLLLKSGHVILRLEFLLSTIITCSTTISGFVLTAISILIGFEAHPVMKEMKKVDGLAELTIRFAETLILGAAVIIFSLIIGEAAGKGNYVGRTYLIAGIGLISSYVCCIVTVFFYLLSILIHLCEIPPIARNNHASVPCGEMRI